MPKNLKGAKGAKASVDDVGEENKFSAVTTKKPAAPKKSVLGKKKADANVDVGEEEKEEEEVIAFGLADETPNGKPAAKVKKPPQKRPKVQKIEPSDIPEVRIPDSPPTPWELKARNGGGFTFY